MWDYLSKNPKTTSLAAGAVLVLAASYLNIISKDQAQMAILTILATLGVVSRDA